MYGAIAAASSVYMRYKATERYRYGWTPPINDTRTLWEPTWEHCEVCGRETPHKRFERHSFCIYSDMHAADNDITEVHHEISSNELRADSAGR